jgi:hypothetical protein
MTVPTLLLACGVTLAGLLTLFVVGEAIARLVFAHGKYYVWPPYFRIKADLIPEVFPGLDPKVTFCINSDGERGSEPPRSLDGLYRILVVGGSAAECFLLDQEACWPMRIHRNLNTPSALSALRVTQVHVGSIAKSFVDSAKLNLILRRVLPQYRKIDAVFIMVGASDILNWLRSSAPENPKPAVVEAADVFKCNPEARYHWYPPKDTASAECWRRLRRRLFRWEAEWSAYGSSVLKLQAMRQRAKIIKSEVPAHATLLDNYANFLGMSIRLIQDSGARVLVIPQPWLPPENLTEAERKRLWNGAEGDPHKQDVSTYYSSELIARLQSEVNEVACRVAKEHGAQIVHVQECLTPPPACFHDDFHCTPLGAEIVADIVSKAFLDHYSESSPEPGSNRTREVGLTRPGVASQDLH